MAAKLDTVTNASLMSDASPSIPRDGLESHETVNQYLNGTYSSCIPSYPGFPHFSSMTPSNVDPLVEQQNNGLSEQDIQNILFPDLPYSSTVPPEPSTLPIEWAEQEFARPATTRLDPPPEISPDGLVSTRTVSGLPPDLEFLMLQEFSALGALQLPVLDIDMIFIRYRFRTPTPLPAYLLLTVVSCGAYYSSRRKDPGIDGRTAQLIYDEAKREIIRVAVKDLSVDSVTALSLMSFHWSGEMSSYERGMLATLSVQKVQSMRLHTPEGLNNGRSSRERGVIKHLVWLNYIVDAFASTQDFETQGLSSSRIPYNGQEIQLGLLELEDTEAIRIEYLTGIERIEWTGLKSLRGLIFLKAFSSLAKLQNTARNQQMAGSSLQRLVKYLDDWEAEYFPEFDLTLIPWDYAHNCYYNLESLTPGVCSLNFSYWYCQCFVHFDALRSTFVMSGTNPATPGSPRRVDNDKQGNIRACMRAFMASISIFEVLCAANYVAQLSQVLRGHLYFGGRILQLLFQNKVILDGVLAVDSSLLSRWERCLETAELIWGFSSSGIDLAIMSLDDNDQSTDFTTS